MKIIDVYDKNSELKYGGKTIFGILDNFFSCLPSEYSKNYYNNLESLKIFKVDRMHNENEHGEYLPDNNVIYFQNKKDLGHEIMHMCSYDSESQGFAFSDKVLTYETGLIEGMTEYLNMQVFNNKIPHAYSFETFCVSMLSEIDNIFRPYFVASHEEFINLFSNSRDIYSLMYSLDYYSSNIVEYIDSLDTIEPDRYSSLKKGLCESFEDTINSLINIELSYQKDNKLLMLYFEKFLDLINSNHVKVYIREFYPKYVGYVHGCLKKRVRIKR